MLGRRTFAAGLLALTLGVTALLPPPAAAQTLEKVTFALDFRALGRHAAWFLALDKGYYRDAGLDVSIIPSDGTAQAIQSLESGLSQLAFSDVAGLVTARANAQSTVKMLAVIYQKSPYAVFSLASGANLTTPEQLQGLTIGSGAGSFTQKVIDSFMRSKGLKPETVKYVNIDPAARVSMLVSKQVPAIETFIMSEPGIVKAAGADEERAFLFADHGLTLYSNGILATEKYLAAKPDVVRGFIKASLQGWHDTLADPGAAANAFMKRNKGFDRDVVLAEIKIVDGLVTTPQVQASGLGSFDPAAMQQSVDLILTGIGAKEPMTAATVADSGFLPQPPIKP